MKPIESTYEILAWKNLNKNVDEKWVDWAIKMMKAGFENEHIIELAGMTKPFNQFEMHDLVDRALSELNLDYSDRKTVLDNYVKYLMKEVLNKKRELLSVLDYIRNLHIDLDLISGYEDFYLLYYAKRELMDSEIQWYWDGADRSNIDQICFDHFKNWLENNV